MRIAVLTGLFACTLIFSVGTQTSSAQEPEVARIVANETTTKGATVVSLLSTTTETALKVIVADDKEDAPASEPVAPEPTKHVVTENETLSVIAEKYQTTWKRLFDKNTNIENPDILAVGMELIIPTAEEQLTERPLPEPPVVEEPQLPAKPVQKVQKPVERPAQTTRGSSTGNGYVAGYCTWYVKNRRPDLPNNLGNAATWVSRAAAQGLPTGSAPATGAVGQRGNHVVYVESVNGDGTVTISEMNYQARYAITTRTVPSNYFSYIY